MEWVNAALLENPSSPRSSGGQNLNPSVTVTDDFGPSVIPSAQATITKMSRAQLSQMDLASFSDRFGTLTLGGGRRGGGHKMLRQESGFDLAGWADDEVY